jgi:cytochrome P450
VPQAKKNHPGGFTARRLAPEGNPDQDVEEDEITKNVATALYGGAVDTIAAALLAFFFLMATYPDVQRRAQTELDDVIGRSQLPTEADFGRADLPYVHALIKEVLRWAPSAPLGTSRHCRFMRMLISSAGLPHVVHSDDEYAGYHIPRGMFIIANIW